MNKEISPWREEIRYAFEKGVDEEYWIKKGLESLKAFLPERYGYRSPGWQTSNKTVSILKKLCFSYIAYETKIKNLNNETNTETNIRNTASIVG